MINEIPITQSQLGIESLRFYLPLGFGDWGFFENIILVSLSTVEADSTFLFDDRYAFRQVNYRINRTVGY